MPRKKKVMPKKTGRKKTVKTRKTASQSRVKKAVKKNIVNTKKTTSPAKVRISKSKTYSLLRGMKDILPKGELYWKKMRRTVEDLTEAYGYGYMETPILEEASLFIRSIGRGTDVVDKEMYIFEDRDGSKVCLRPEATASCARAYVSHGMQSYSQPVKLWYWGPMFRHDRPQAGRYREFHQFGCEVLGSKSPVVDAELISVAYNFLKDLGIESNIHINSIGNLEERQNYIVELVGYLRSKRVYLCDNCKKRITKNPLRVLDCKGEDCQKVVEEAPQIIDWLSEDSKNFFMSVLEYLDEAEVPYVLKPTLVRGLDYYTDTVFEIYKEEGEEGAQSALGGGGRYDPLVEQLGGQETPGSGFSIGLERVVSVLRKQKEEGKLSFEPKKYRLFFAQLGEQASRKTLKIIEDLRREGIIVKHNLAKTALKAQLELANKYGVDYTIILGQKEVQDDTIIVRDMESGIQEIIDQKKLKNVLKKKLGL